MSDYEIFEHYNKYSDKEVDEMIAGLTPRQQLEFDRIMEETEEPRIALFVAKQYPTER
ncbi:MAG: hypothetical protein QMD92_00060 [bacterium]|nr:hypothetical protein [bacterium]